MNIVACPTKLVVVIIILEPKVFISLYAWPQNLEAFSNLPQKHDMAWYLISNIMIKVNNYNQIKIWYNYNHMYMYLPFFILKDLTFSTNLNFWTWFLSSSGLKCIEKEKEVRKTAGSDWRHIEHNWIPEGSFRKC